MQPTIIALISRSTFFSFMVLIVRATSSSASSSGDRS
jgi:hypothetical protein